MKIKVATYFRLRLRPRMLRDVSRRDLSVTVFGSKILMPVGISPTAMQKMAHPEGECANARGSILFKIQKI